MKPSAPEMPDETNNQADAEQRASDLLARGRARAAEGRIDEALRCFEQVRALLPSSREHAMALGEIAGIRAENGELEQALELQEEQLGFFESLKDSDGIASTLWSIAQIELQQRRYQEAFDNLARSYKINLELERLDGISAVGLDLGQLLCGAGHPEEGIKVLERSRKGFEQLGQLDNARQTQAIIAHFSQGGPSV